MAALMPEKGIDGIAPDNDFINKLLSPESKVDIASKKGPAKAFLVQLAHKSETRWASNPSNLSKRHLLLNSCISPRAAFLVPCAALSTGNSTTAVVELYNCFQTLQAVQRLDEE